jgi:hypothetical protein
MKNTIAVFVCIILISGSIFGQFSIRPYIGINSAKITEDFEDINWQSQLGYQGGIDLQIGDKFYLQPGLQWELIRTNFDPQNPIPGLDTKFKASHIRIPLMLGVKALSSSSNLFNFRIYTGPDVAFTVSHSDHSFLGVEINDDTYNKLHWSWNGGVGVDFLFLFVDVGYKFGVSEYFNQDNVNNPARTNVFFANVGMKF